MQQSKQSSRLEGVRPGEHINEAYVSATLGIGRTPIHQAPDRLMLEGMVEIIPRKGAYVTSNSARLDRKRMTETLASGRCKATVKQAAR